MTKKINKKAHRKGKCTFCFLPKAFLTKKTKRAFPFPLLPTLKKRINFLLSIPKNQPCRIDGTAYNKSFARLRGKVQNSSLLPIFEHWCLIESFGIFSPQPRKAPNRCAQYYRRDFQTKLMRFFLTLNCSFCWLNSESEFTFGKITALRIAA